MGAGTRFESSPAGLAPGRGYSQVVSGSGRLVLVSGQVALDEIGGIVGEGDPEAQTVRVFRNIEMALRSAGASFDDVVKLGIHVTDAACLPARRSVRD